MQNVWKCTVQIFSHLQFKYAKSAIKTQQIFFLKNINMGIKKRRILCCFQIRWCRLKEKPLKKLELLTFVTGISETRQQWIWNQHKILSFFDTHIDIFQEKKYWVIIALFAYFKCKFEKICTFSNILQKVKSYFFAIIYQSPFDSYWNSKKSIKI